jgi:F0F1-type ATP synthase membrane subunit b/b'|eukprot:scaffold13468_cov128-Skeletonema_marinoi.AAC.2
MRAVFRYINYYKDEHKATLKEATTLLELALWKANLDEKEKEKEKDSFGERKTKRAKVDAGSEKNEVKSHLVRI